MILIVADDNYPGVASVVDRLGAVGAKYLRFHPRQFPSEASLSTSYDRSGVRRQLLRYGNCRLDLDTVTALWDLSRVRPVPEAGLAAEHRWWVAENCSRWLSESWDCLNCLCLPGRPLGPAVSERPLGLWTPSGHNKLHQLTVAARMGFDVPRTLVTNSPEEFLRFSEECGGAVVSKTPFRIATTRNGEKVRQFTQRVDRRGAARYQSIRYAPVIFQEEIEKRIELRVTVIGRTVLAAAIHSQENSRQSGDWRHYPEFDPSSRYSAFSLPVRLEKRCADLTAELGLCYGAIDLILTPQGDYVFLELNPHGQWDFIEQGTGLPIADALARLLTRGTV